MRTQVTDRAQILKALGHPARMSMVESLAGGEKCVCALVEEAGLDFSTVSKHLTILRNAGIVESDKRGRWVWYRLKVPCIMKFLDCADAVLKGKCP
ncbi:MAG TPA: transcriptional regulator [Rhodospirillaceae bacterium]|nr:MAG: transcriptional regulator [Alphaproteobacteria bacterium GWF2_58_20]HAU28627.1 transcriptional regulator [Rhodospirillaceae bacterium]